MLLKDYFNSSMSSVKVKDGIVLHPEDEELIQNVTDFIKNNIDDELPLKQKSFNHGMDFAVGTVTKYMIFLLSSTI